MQGEEASAIGNADDVSAVGNTDDIGNEDLQSVESQHRNDDKDVTAGDEEEDAEAQAVIGRRRRRVPTDNDRLKDRRRRLRSYYDIGGQFTIMTLSLSYA